MDQNYSNLFYEINTNLSFIEYPNFTRAITQSDPLKVSYDEKLYQIPPILVTILFIAYGTIFIMALVGNGLVLWLVLLSRRMWSVTNFFLTNLALADIIIALFTVPFHFQAALFQRWDIPKFLCPLCPFTQELSVSVSVFTLAAIAVQRYGAVIHPLHVMSSKCRAIFVLISIWVIAFLAAFPTYMDFTVKTYRSRDKTEIIPFCKSEYLSPTFKWYYYQSLVCTQYIVPLVIICLAYYKTGTHLWKTETPGNNDKYRDAKILRNKKKVTRMMLIVVLMFALCWLPFQSYKFLEIHFPRINDYYYINVVWFCMHWLAMSNSCVNPFIYAILNEKFKEEFKLRWNKKLKIFCQNNGNDNEVSSIDIENNVQVQNVGISAEPVDV